MQDVSGNSGEAQIWAAVKSFLHAWQASRAPRAPVGLVQSDVEFVTASERGKRPAGLEAARQEWFLPGTRQTMFAIN